MINKKLFIFSSLLICLSIFIIYIFIFIFYFIYLDNNFNKTFKHSQTINFYKKYINTIEHLRYEDDYLSKKMESELVFNFIKKDSNKNIILFQGDSWMYQLNKNQSTKNILKKYLTRFTKIVNGGTSSYSPSLMYKQFQILEKDYDIKPKVLVIYIDQTDMGDELCRYKNLIKYDQNGKLESIGAEKYPYYRGVFNLQEKIILSEIDQKKVNRLFKTQLLINYKAKKALERMKKKFVLMFIDSSRYKKCRWQVIENYKKQLSKDDRSYLINIFQEYFLYLIGKDFIEKIFVVTHPHKLQLTTDSEPIDISDIISETIIKLPKISHINFSKILENNKNFYQDYQTIWSNDNIHLNDKNYDIFIKKIVTEIN
ncbi:MAG: hypothetical protein CBE33_01045 [Candidatus Pelagibacter sp. TMED273]|nr:MAG: hypothetical protein CBE33_01045 [Candidatus Pelagibacter sp. TMED273]